MSIKIVLEIGHQASLIKNPSNFTHNWELFVRGVDGADISLYVDKVVVTLHESFPKPKRVLKDPPYVVKEAGYAGFEMPVIIFFKGKPEKFELKYDMDLQPYKVQKEEYIFHNPSEDFKRRLLKGGGIPLSKESSMSSIKNSSNSSDVKKHKHKDESKPSNTFKTLFGTPITKSSTKVSPDPKSQMQQNKISPNSVKSSKAEKPEKVSSSSSSSKDKSEKHKSKHHSPSRERMSENKDSRRDKDGDSSSRHEKKKDKSHSKEKSSSKSKTKDKARSPSPKRPSSPLPIIKPKSVEPPLAPTAPDKSSTSSSKKSSKKDKKSSDRDKKEGKSKESDKKSEHTKSNNKDKETGQSNNSTKDVLKEKPKHENKIEHSNPATPISDKKSEKGDSERKHKHKKKEKSKDHDREKDLSKEKKSSGKNSHKQNKEESNHAVPSPAKQQKRPESRKQHNENTHSQPPTSTKSSSRAIPITNHETSDSDADSHALSSKIDSDNSPERRSIKREESSPSPSPPAPIPEPRQSKRDKPIKDEKKRKRKTKNESDHSPSPSSLMEPPQQKIRKDEIKNGETPGYTNTTPTTNNYESVSSSKSAFISPSSTSQSDRIGLSNDYMTELKDLQHKIMTLQDNNDLQQVVEMIAATGQYEITSKTFDFDLCALEPGLIKRLQEFFGATASCS